MSTERPSVDDLPPRPKHYRPGTDSPRYSRFAEDWLDVTRTHVLDTIHKALEDHQQIVVLGGNGVGKSFFVGVAGISALYTNPNTIVHVTAGTSSTLKNNIWKPTRGLFKTAKKDYGIPGRTLDGTREIRSGLGDKWYFECVSPRYPDDLEGPHNENVIYFIEEADKPGVTAEHIDSVRSTVTSQNDRVVVVANPPTDETNVVSELVASDEWKTLRFPSWESQNVRIERGLDEGEKIGGLATVWKMQQDWEEYHDEEWPGLEQAIQWSDPGEGGTAKNPTNPDFREDLHDLWYKRRAGLMPPESSETWRPFSVQDVKDAYRRPRSQLTVRDTPTSVGIDVARSGDDTVMIGDHMEELQVHYSEQGTHHQQQGRDLAAKIKSWPNPDITVDAVGEGSGLADILDDKFPNVYRYSNGSKATDEDSYRYKWDEALQILGDYLNDGGSFSDEQLREELIAAARVVKFRERSLASRGGDVIEATSKEEIKDYLGHSPDHLDAALMAVWRAAGNGDTTTRSISSTW